MPGCAVGVDAGLKTGADDANATRMGGSPGGRRGMRRVELCNMGACESWQSVLMMMMIRLDRCRVEDLDL